MCVDVDVDVDVSVYEARRAGDGDDGKERE